MSIHPAFFTVESFTDTFTNGDAFVYTSAAADPDCMQYIPKGLQVICSGVNQIGEIMFLDCLDKPRGSYGWVTLSTHIRPIPSSL
jgi:hypothetical protein